MHQLNFLGRTELKVLRTIKNERADIVISEQVVANARSCVFQLRRARLKVKRSCGSSFVRVSELIRSAAYRR